LWIVRHLVARGDKRPWSAEEIARLRAHYSNATPAELERMLPGRALAAIRRQAQSLGVRRMRAAIPHGIGPAWTDPEDAVIRAYAVSELSHAELRGQLPHRTWDAILWRQQKLQLNGRTSRILYRVEDDAREIVQQGGHSRIE
jgi:hypothetical protein